MLPSFITCILPLFPPGPPSPVPRPPASGISHSSPQISRPAAHFSHLLEGSMKEAHASAPIVSPCTPVHRFHCQPPPPVQRFQQGPGGREKKGERKNKMSGLQSDVARGGKRVFSQEIRGNTSILGGSLGRRTLMVSFPFPGLAQSSMGKVRRT